MVEHFVARGGKNTISVTPVLRKNYKSWLGKQAKATQNWLNGSGFEPDGGNVALIPDRNGRVARVVLGLGSHPGLWAFAALAGKLPKGRYAFDNTLTAQAAPDAALGWALATYRFTRYRESNKTFPTLVWPEAIDRNAVTRLAEGIALGRDLINTPASDMGPVELAGAAETLAGRHGAKTTVITGDALLKKNYPAIHAVGRASDRQPRLIDLRWGDPKAPRVTLVGKGVCFDSGGLDLKNASGMKLMKKDMGGAASVLALSHMIMDAALPLRLRVLIPAVENSVSGNAFRPGDVLATRKGLSVEVGNTDAEGRLVLCDALTEADSEDPELLVDFATLTGAARVALGTELPALFCDDDGFATSVLRAGERHTDPLWRMPLFSAYRRHLDSPIADLNNIASVGFGGAITAALFLKEFVSSQRTWAHVDTMAWNASHRAGRPTGGDVFGVRAFFAVLSERYID
jgi:leucyl aminopeptidase